MLVMATCSRSTGGVGVSGGVQDTNRTIGARSTRVGIEGTNSSSTGTRSTHHKCIYVGWRCIVVLLVLTVLLMIQGV